MKISYICPTNCVRRPIAEMSVMLSEQGHEILVAYPFSEDCSTKNWAPNAKIEGNSSVQVEYIASWYISSLRYNITKPFAMLRSMRRIFAADIVHLWEYWYPLSVFVILYALFTGQRKKLIMTTDGLVGYSYVPKDPWWLVPAFRLYTKTFGQILFRIPGQLTTYGKAMLPYAKRAGMPLKNLSVLGTGIHLDTFQTVSSESVEALRREFSVKEDEKVLLFVGMLSERKGVKTVVEVGRRLLDSGEHVKVLIVGNSFPEEPYAKLVPKKYKEKIIFAGSRRDIPVWMNMADCLLLPSEGEGLPGVVMEAMAAGTACVVTNEGCTPDLIDSGKSGFLVAFGDVDSYEAAVRQILADSQNFGDAAFEKISTFDWKKVTVKYLEYYQNNVLSINIE